MRKIFRLFALTAPVLALALAGLGAAAGKTAMVITVDGAINPVVAEYITESITAADEDAATELLVIEMDTPGGLDTSMRQIIKGIQSSRKPVVVFVSPSGSRAASAGAFITVAAHIAAMAPGTNIGSASPVNMGGGMDRTMKKKVTNDAAAYIKSIAESHGRNAEIAEDFVRKASNIPETEAKEKNVIDLIADDLNALLKAVDGMTVKTASGETKIDTADASIKRVEMNFRQRIFNALANPNVAYMLMMLGFYGLIFELSNPGAILPGVVGAICLILGFYSLQALPINYAGALLIVLAFIMFLLEIKVPSYGALTIGGIVSLAIGSLMLVDSPADYMRISISVVGPTALFSGAFFFFIVGAALRIQGKRTKTGQEGLVGALGVAETDITPDAPGKVFMLGELWDAVTEKEPIPKNAPVEITGYAGLKVTVRPIKNAAEKKE